jgi:hypothetical protein
MGLEGTVVNGAIRLDGNPQLPEGARVRVEFENADELDDIPPPPATESYEEHLAILRESIEEARTGQTRPAREVLKELAAKYGLSPQPGD